MSSDARRPASRRAFLGMSGLAAGGVVAGAVAGCTSDADPGRATSEASDASDASSSAAAGPVPATGRHQAGVVTPQPAQTHLVLTVYDLTTTADAATLLRRLGTTITGLTAGSDPDLLGMPPGDLTVTVGVGPDVVAAVDPELPGADPLPRFGAHERFGPRGAGGDVVVQVCASDPLVVAAAAATITASGGAAWRERWTQDAFRAQQVPITATATAPRNLLGFVDGIVGPRTQQEFDADVWLRAPDRVAGGTIMVVRRMQVDVARFASLSVTEQQRVFGRTRTSARPLSGGTIATDPDLGAKTPTGAYVIPADAHLRRANPASAGVPPMLRRSYSFGGGLLFVSFQDELRTFVATLERMTTKDALLPYTTTTHAGSFLVLPGFTARRPLGAGLLGRK